jgi:antitoxin component YwqK of YwqJK toxin-antitoxin module
MKKLFFIVLFFISINIVFAQSYELLNGDTINRIDANKMKQGHWVITGKIKKLPGYGEDSKIEEGDYLDNKKVSTWIQYYSNGKIKNEIPFVNNRPNGYAKMYYESGKLSEEGMWKETKWVGVYKYYYENGNPAKEWNHDESGRRVGVQKYFHENGKVMIEGEWKDGKESGVIKEYYANGDLKSEKTFNDGGFDDKSSKSYEPVNPMETEVEVKEVPKEKEEKEIKIVEEISKDPVNVGVFDGNGQHKMFNKSGQVIKDGLFENGKLVDGKQYTYSSDGKLLKTTVFKGGRVVEEKEE